jgi:FkbM family methyltransferase
MTTLAQALDQAIGYHQRGHLREAEQLCRQILQADPQQVDALHLLGVLAHQLGRNDLALDYLGQAVRLNPDLAEAHHNLGRVLAAQGRPAAAVACYQQALQLQPGHAAAHNNLGVAWKAQGRLDEAVACYQQAVRLQPDYAWAHYNLGVALQEQGRLAEAAASLQQAVRLQPDFAAAHNQLGIALAGRGRPAEAVSSFQEAVRLQPDWAEGQHNLGLAWKAQGRLDEAVACYQQALRLKPDYPEARHNLGILLAEQGKVDEAVACYQQALRLKPDLAEVHNNLGVALQGQGKLDEAVACFQQVLRLQPDYAEARNNLGNALQCRGELDAAVACYQEALRLKPDLAEVHNNLGNALQCRGELDEAVACCRQALRLKPDYAEAYNNLGNALQCRGELDEAVACYQQALRLKPDYAEAYNNLGRALRDRGELDEAVACYQQALRLQPNLAEAHLNRALAWLRSGDFEGGWPEYEWRWGCKEFLPPSYPQPPWDGSPLAGRTILLYTEQGLGDTIQFIRYAPLVQQRGGRVIVACQKPLARLLARCPGIDQLVTKGEALPPFEVHAPLLSLPRLFGTTLASIPAEVPYLRADEALVAQWCRELAPIRAFKVGIAWQGSLKHRGDRHRSFRLAQLAPLARLAGVRLFSLQKGPGTEQLREVADRFDVTDLGSRLDDFLDTAAVMRNLDLVITADSAPAHLAGALGVPVWVALPYASDWRWLLGREDSPWYPTMRLFRQARFGDWDGVFAEIRVAAEKMAAEKREQGTGGKTPGTRGTRSPASHPGQEAQTPAVVPDPMRGDSRLLLDQGHVRVKHCRYGPMAYLATDRYVGQSLDRYGEFSEGEVELFRQVIRTGWTVVEIGANMGAHTVSLAKATGSLGRVLAFEPQRVIFQILCANLVLNGLSHVETFHAAAGREPGTITVPCLDYTARQNFGGVSLGSHAAGEAVQQMTIDGLNLPACHLLKIDVEGMEGEVLAGAEQTIRRWRPVLYVENDRPEKSAALIRQALGLGYRLYWHLPRLFNPHNYFGVTENIFGTIVSVNMLGFHGSVSQNTNLREITDPEDDWKIRC